ncbi:MAG: prepilin peptidase [Candidatus Saccharibacteria bacterium]|nr:prepilin peptidase [Candidatus Saccharibacteria bacterium]
MEIAFLILLFIIGSCFGSFLCCQARRLRLKSTKKGSKKLGSRSVCLHCYYQLKWYDNIPIISWLLLRGKCRKCHQKIGVAEIISELSAGIAFLAFGAQFVFATAVPLDWLAFVFILLLSLVLIFLAIYDGLYGELPTLYLIVAIILAVLVSAIKQIILSQTTGFTPESIYQPLLAVLILGGLYFALYFISKGKWVGDGDWLLGIAIGLALGSPWLALIALFVANLLACLFALPTLKKSKKIHLGPFLVASFVITSTFADFLQSML